MSVFKGKKITVIAAHPDDEVLGAGGFLAEHGGEETSVIYLGTGVAGRYENPQVHDEDIAHEVAELKACAESSCAILKVNHVYFLDYPDNALDTVPRMDIVHKLRAILEKLQPDVVLIHHHGDYNWDHCVAHEVCLMATRACAGEIFPSMVLSYEVPSATERSFKSGGYSFSPNIYMDISNSLDLKLKAMSCFVTESQPFPHPRSSKSLKCKALSRGAEAGLNAAECFELVRWVGPDVNCSKAGV